MDLHLPYVLLRECKDGHSGSTRPYRDGERRENSARLVISRSVYCMPLDLAVAELADAMVRALRRCFLTSNVPSPSSSRNALMHEHIFTLLISFVSMLAELSRWNQTGGALQPGPQFEQSCPSPRHRRPRAVKGRRKTASSCLTVLSSSNLCHPTYNARSPLARQ